ncbi:MAG: 2-C-methyl-D-erythritol 4-phosphate cytidylyltransferase [Lachnospiraceae bacterium]|nr:2-C-methyl-D-erythritol 4-phosphate cytidylyltransferase [Lachnospiraceae bacterium]
MNHAILLSGGRGSRTGSDIPKQYVRSNGKMMVTYALERLLECDWIDKVCIVCEGDFERDILDDMETFGIGKDRLDGFAHPGETRQGSILSGLAHIESTHGVSDDDTVLIHDGVRPYLTGELLLRCYEGLAGHDGVMPAIPMKDTVYLCDAGGSVSGLLDRNRIHAGQAPELFKLKKYLGANRALSREGFLKITGASEPAVMAGMDVFVIRGEEGNVKVTSPGDLSAFVNR